MSKIRLILNKILSRKIALVVATAFIVAVGITFIAVTQATHQNIDWVFRFNSSPTGCINVNPASPQTLQWIVDVNNRGPGRMHTIRVGFHDNQAGCGITTAGAVRFDMTGKTDYFQGESGSTTFTYNTGWANCGRVQVDAAFRSDDESVSNDPDIVFFAAIINYGVDCGVTPPSDTGKIRVINREFGTNKDVFACWTLIRENPAQRWEGQCATTHTYNDFAFGRYTIIVDQNGTTHNFHSVDPVGWQNLSNGTPGGVIQWIVYWTPKVLAPTTGKITVSNKELNTNRDVFAEWTLVRQTPNPQRWEQQRATTHTYENFPFGTYTIEMQPGLTHDFDHFDRPGPQTLSSSNSHIQWTVFWRPKTQPQNFTLTVHKAGNGSGTVTGLGINCGSDCSETYPALAIIELKATPDSGSVFAGWSGACTHPQNCIVFMDANKSVTATFNKVVPGNFTLTVHKAGNGSGTVTGLGINCGSDCSETYAAGTVVTLEDRPDAGSSFSGWSGACSGGNCTVTMNSDKNVTATFTKISPQRFTLTVNKAGSGSGTVTGLGINCGSDCSETYQAGSVIELFASPDSGSVFAGWSNACTHPQNCIIVMNSDKTVTATFNRVGTASIDLTKTVRNVTQNQANFVSATNANPGDEVEYRIVASASGNNVSSVSIFDDIRTDKLTFVSGSIRIDGTVDSGSLSHIGLGTINAGHSKVITFRARVAPSSAFSVGSHTLFNVATVNSSAGSKSSGAEVGVRLPTRVTPPPPPPPPPPPGPPTTVNLTIEKQVRNVSRNETSFVESINASPNEQVEFRIVVTASGNTTANNVTVSDMLPANFNFNFSTLDSGVTGNITSGFNLGNLNPSSSKTVRITATTASESNFPVGSSGWVNTANAQASNVSTVSNTAGIVVIRTAPASVSLTVNKQARNISRNETTFQEVVNASPGEQIEFRIQITPSGGSANNVVVTDTLPSNFTANSATTLNLGSISANSTNTVSVIARAASESNFPVGSSSWDNSASVTASNAATMSDRATVVVTRGFFAQQQVSLSVDKQVRNVTTNSGFLKSVLANPSEQVEFRIIVTASGTTTANNVVVNDSLPSNFNFNFANFNSGITQISNTSFNLGNLSPGSSRTIRITAQAASESNFPFGTSNWVNTAVATSANAGSQTDSASVNINRAGGGGLSNTFLSITKQGRNLTTGSGFSRSISARTNERVEFRIEIRNQGSITANNVRVFDSFPSSLNLVPGSVRVDGSSSFSGDLFSNNLLLGSLFPGNLRVITFEANVPSSTFTLPVTNSANSFADNASSVSDSAQVLLQGAVAGTSIDLALSKRAFNNTQNTDATLVTANPGDLITYTLSVQNRGNADATNFVFEENLTDVLELAELTDFGGASFELARHTLRWPAVTIPAFGRVDKTFSVRIRTSLPATSDFVMSNVYGNTVSVNVRRPAVAGRFVAPRTGSTATISLVLASLTLAGFAIYHKRESFISFVKRFNNQA